MMSLLTRLGSLGCLILGHAPTIEINESANRSELVCERCGVVLDIFVTNLRKHPIVPTTQVAQLQHNSVACS
jgi:hypothetical protein